MPQSPSEAHPRSPVEAPSSRNRRRGRVVVGGLVGLAAVAALIAACSGSSDPDPATGSSSTPAPDPGGSSSSEEVSAVGVWGLDAPGQPRLELVEDGSFSGTDGCNRLMGSWTQNEQVVEFTGVGSTRMACPDVDTWLERLVSARVDGDLLHVNAADGVEIGTLDRAG